MNRLSPGPIGGAEYLTRFVVLKSHMSKKGKLMPNCFSQIEDDGCSVQRETVIGSSELATWMGKLLTEKKQLKFLGAVTANCEEIRKLHIDGHSGRHICVYDTVIDRANPCHGEMFKNRHLLKEEDMKEMTRKLLRAFGDVPTLPDKYRQGAIWQALPQDLQNR